MKLPSRRRTRGIAFTLVEILVVIAIIAILAGVILSGIGSALRYAKRTKANAVAVQIQTAVQGYYTEYGVYPSPNGAAGTDDYYDGANNGANWGNLTYVLCGNLDPYTGTSTNTSGTAPPFNTRGIAYMTPTRSDLDSTYHTLKNPFDSAASATYFYMVVDTDYSGVAGDTGNGASQLINFSSGTNIVALGHGVPGGVAVWCSCDQPLLGSGKPSNPNFWAHTY